MMWKNIANLIKKGSKGATAIEYALIASLIAVVAITGMRTIGQNIRNKLDSISHQIADAGNENK